MCVSEHDYSAYLPDSFSLLGLNAFICSYVIKMACDLSKKAADIRIVNFMLNFKNCISFQSFL